MRVGSFGRRRIRRTLLSVLALLGATFTIIAPSAQATASVTVSTADDGGVVVHLVTASTVLWVQASVRASAAPDAAVLYQSDQLAMEGAGGWHSSPVTKLGAEYDYGTYPVDVDYRLLSDSSVVHVAAAGVLAYYPHLAVTSVQSNRASTDYDHQSVTMSGAVTSFDPKTGDTGPATAGVKVHLTWNAYNGIVTGTFQADTMTGAGGTFSQVITPHGASNGGQARVVPVDGTQLATAPVAMPDVGAVTSPVRMTASPARVRVHKGKTFTVRGTVQRLTKDGWQPLPNAPVVTTANDPSNTMGAPSGIMGSGPTNTSGAYSYPARATRSGPAYTFVRPSAYLQLSGTVNTDVSVPVAGSFRSLRISIDPFYDVTAKAVLRGPCSGETVTLQYSRNGRTGWTALTRSAQDDYVNTSGCGLTIQHGAPGDGYYRLVHAESDAMLAVASATVRLHRIATRTSFAISPKTASRNAPLHASGTVTQLIAGHWKRYAHARVVLVFRPKGDTNWYWVVKGWTTSTGHYALKGKAYGSGSWGVYYAADRTHYYSEGKPQYVKVS